MPDFAAFARFAPNLTHPLVLAGFGRRLGAGSGNAFLGAPTRPGRARPDRAPTAAERGVFENPRRRGRLRVSP